MKDLILTICAIFFSVLVYSQTSIMTYNIRFSNPGDKENSWDNRKEEVVDMLQYYHPDIFGVQEGLVGQLNFIDKGLPNYTYTGVGRDDGKDGGEFTAIFYDTTAYELLDSKHFWLSETPDTPSKGWDASYLRITTIGTFLRKGEMDTIIVFNNHFDNEGKLARSNSANFIVQYIVNNNLLNKKLVVIGDLNCEADEEPIQILKTILDDAREHSVTPPYGPDGTFNGFDTNKVLDWKIDYVFTRNLIVNSHRVVDDRRKNGLWLSDHLPVFCTIK